MHTRLLTLTALGTVLLTTPALADRAADAPIRAPRTLRSHHISFDLRGSGWAQVVGSLSGTPSFGNYAVDTKTPGGTDCQLSASVSAKASARRPVVRGNRVQPKPGTRGSAVLRASRRGTNGPVRWWSGTMRDTSAAAVGVQRLPASLATTARPWLVYSVRIDNSSFPADNADCIAHARRAGAAIALRIARTMRIAAGPPVSRAPFIS
jgi:hypothetical protein